MSSSIDLSELENDQFDFTSFASSVVSTENVSETLRCINEKLDALDSSIDSHVVAHHRELLSKASELDQFASDLLGVQGKIEHLAGTVESLRLRINQPYQALSTSVSRFGRLVNAAQALRKVVRASALVKRIENNRTTDIAKTAVDLSELQILLDSTDCQGIHFLETCGRVAVECREELTRRSWDMIDSSFALSDQSQLGLGLTVLYHLQILGKAVAKCIAQWKVDFSSNLTNAVDIDGLAQRARRRQGEGATGTGSPVGPGRASVSLTSGHSVAFHVAMWTSLDGAMDNLERLMGQIELLNTTLLASQSVPWAVEDLISCSQLISISCNRDSDSLCMADLLASSIIAAASKNNATVHNLIPKLNAAERESVLMLFASNEANSLLSQENNCDVMLSSSQQQARAQLASQLHATPSFFAWACSDLHKQLTKAASASSQLKEALESEYPKLLKLLLGTLRHPSPSTGDRRHFYSPLPSCLMEAVKPFETAYLSRSLSRLFDRVAMTLTSVNSSSSGGDENLVDLNSIVRNAGNELAYASVHYDLVCKVARNIAKTVVAFVGKIESLVSQNSGSVNLASIAVVSNRQSTDSPTTVARQKQALVFHLKLVNLLCAFASQLQSTCARRMRPVLTATPASPKPHPMTTITKALATHVNAQCLAIIEPITKQLAIEINKRIASSKQQPRTDDDLQHFATNWRQNYLALLSSPPSSSNTINNEMTDSSTDTFFTHGKAVYQHVASEWLLPYIVDTFMYRACLVEQSSERRSSDIDRLNKVLTSLTFDPIDAVRGRLQAFQGIDNLLLTTSDGSDRVVNDQALLNLITSVSDKEKDSVKQDIKVDQLLPLSLIGHYLFSLARDSRIQPPHEYVAEWTLSRYLDWLTSDDRCEQDRLIFLQNSLARYAKEVQNRQQKEYPRIYLTIRNFLSKALDHLSANEQSNDT